MSVTPQQLYNAFRDSGDHRSLPPWEQLSWGTRDRWSHTLSVLNGLGHSTTSGNTRERLMALTDIMERSGNPDSDFFYLAGPMTGIPRFNFPRFKAVANRLRGLGYNIVSPAELDDPETEAAALASPDGAPGSGTTNGEAYEDFLGRDLIICSLPTCVGAILIEGWHNSRGARGESWIVAYLRKQLLEYYEDFEDADGERHPVALVSIDRDERLAELGVPDYARGSVPRDRPGLLTVAASGPPAPPPAGTERVAQQAPTREVYA